MKVWYWKKFRWRHWRLGIVHALIRCLAGGAREAAAASEADVEVDAAGGLFEVDGAHRPEALKTEGGGEQLELQVVGHQIGSGLATGTVKRTGATRYPHGSRRDRKFQNLKTRSSNQT